MAQEFWNAAFRAARRPRWFFVMRPEAAMAHAALPRHTRELSIWRMAAALRVDVVAAIKSGALTRDAPLDLLHSMTRRCAACDATDACLAQIQAAGDCLDAPPKYCRVKNRLAMLLPGSAPLAHQDQAS